MASINRAFGKAAIVASAADCKLLENLYWYTVEFGLVEESGQLKTWGAGLLSSFGELGQIEHGPELCRLDAGQAAQTDYDPTYYQKTLFVADSVDHAIRVTTEWLDSFIRSRR